MLKWVEDVKAVRGQSGGLSDHTIVLCKIGSGSELYKEEDEWR